MLSSLLRPKKGARRRVDPSPYSSHFVRERDKTPEHARDTRQPAAKYNEPPETEDEIEPELSGEDGNGRCYHDEDGRMDATPLLPIFSLSLGWLFV